MKDNIIPFRKYDRFTMTRGSVSSNGEVIEKEPIGFAFLKPGSKMFRLKIWAYPNVSYFLTQDEKSELDQYQVLALEEYHSSNGELKSNWNKVGQGHLVGNFIQFKIQFFADDIFLCLFPQNEKEESIAI